MSGWQPMKTAPKDRQILVRRHNDISYEYHIVWWLEDPTYPWSSGDNAYPTGRLDDWHEIPADSLDKRSARLAQQ